MHLCEFNYIYTHASLDIRNYELKFIDTVTSRGFRLNEKLFGSHFCFKEIRINIKQTLKN